MILAHKDFYSETIVFRHVRINVVLRGRRMLKS